MIDSRRAYTYFKNNFVMKPSSQNWYAFDCPYCDGGKHKKNAAVKFSWRIVKCWSCEYSETITTFIMDMEGMTYKQLLDYAKEIEPSNISLDMLDDISIPIRKTEIQYPVGFKSILEGEGVLGKRARKYLQDVRKLDLKQLDRDGVGYCTAKADKDEENFFGYIIFPFKSKGILEYYIGRDFVGKMRYKNPPKELVGVGKNEILYNEDALMLRKSVFVLEGLIDAMTLGNNSVATLGWSLSPTQKSKLMQSAAEEISFVPDVGYYVKAVKTALPFMKYKKIKVLPIYELADFGKDVNDIGKDKVMSLYENTDYLTFSKAIKILNDSAE